jgi:hypothetical protein
MYWLSKINTKYCIREGYRAAALGSTTDGTTTLQHTDHITTHYTIYHPFDLYFR